MVYYYLLNIYIICIYNYEKMTRPREGNCRPVPLYLDRDEVDKFNSNFGKGRLSEIVREFIHDENIRAAKEKKVMAPGKGPIDIFSNMIFKHEDKRQTTLDIFAKVNEINEFIKEVNDTKLLGQMKRNAHQIEAVARTKLIKISKGLI